MNEVFLACMFAGNTAVLLVTVAKVRAWRKCIREHALEARVCEASARGHANAARTEANYCENTAGRCRQMELSAQHAASRAERAERAGATGTDPAPTGRATGLRLYGADDFDAGGSD